MRRAKALWLALAGSFSVYLIPLVGPHAAWLLGEMLWHGEARRSPQWTALNLSVALVLQAAAAGVFFWFFRKPGWRRALPVLAVFPFVFLTAQWLYMAKIPAIFLEEPDVKAEQGAWPEVCTLPGVSLTDLKTPLELWVRFDNRPSDYGVVTMPGCRLAKVSLPEPKFIPGVGVDFMIDIASVSPGGRAVVQRYENHGSKRSWWLESGNGLLAPIEVPPGYVERDGAPILSTDGRWAGWLLAIPESGPPMLDRVLLRSLDSVGKEKTIDLSGLGPASYVLKKVDMAAEEIEVWRPAGLIAVGFDGKVRRESMRDGETRPQANTYQESGPWWMAWDAYREEGRYRVQWSLAGGSGVHGVPLGRSIHSAAFDEGGRLVAVSVGTSLNIGKAQDAVYVLRASDGQEVFRKYLPAYMRSPVAFLAGGYFAYSDRRGVRVLRVRE